jgi:hypothetical protein
MACGTLDKERRFRPVNQGARHAIYFAPCNYFPDRDFAIFRTGSHGHASGAASLQPRCTTLLPTAAGQRWGSSTVPAAEQGEAEQELPKSIC